MIVDNTKEIINKFLVMPKKSYGQNFLINKSILEKIANQANITKDDCVIEIGPGLGSLTEFLLIKAKKVLCYEIDPNMVNVLNTTLKDYDNKKIILGDFLKQDVIKDTNEYFGKNAKIKVVANLPYYITTPIMFKLFDIKNITDEVFMVQKEMGERFTGKVSTKDYNALTVFVNYYTDTKTCFVVSKKNFYPIPNVDSIVLHSVFNKKALGLESEEKFLNFVKVSFAQRRKTFVNNINSFYKLPKDKLENSLESIGYSKSLRSESLDLKDFAIIYKYLFENGENK